MTRTFLVAVAYNDGVPPDPMADADEIDDALVAAGIDVISVKAWAAPVVAVTPTLPPTA